MNSTTAPCLLTAQSNVPIDIETTEIETDQNYSISICNSVNLELEISKLTVNGVSIKVPIANTVNQFFEISDIPGIQDGRVRIRHYDTATLNYAGVRLSFNKVTPTQNIKIDYEFSPRQEIFPIYTPTIQVDPNMTDAGTIAEDGLSFLENAEDSTSSKWKLTAIPSSGYGLAYIQVGDDASTRVESEDGTTITWEVTSDAAYTAYFTPMTFLYQGDLRIAPVNSTFLPNNLGGAVVPSSQQIFAGQRVGCSFNIFSPTDISGQHILHAELYAGEDTTGELLQAHDYNAKNLLGGFLYRVGFVIDSVPADLEKITAALQLDDGETAVKTFDISVTPSGSTALSFLSSPGGSDISVCYPSDSRTTIGGPTVYDAAAFVDEATGALRLYLAGSGGVFRTDPAAATDLVMMDGMRFAYNDNLVSSGFAFAIGGADEEHLAALVRDNSIKGYSPEYCIYTCADGVWTKTDQSEFAESDAGGMPDLRGLVIAADDIWLCNRHWDGTSWQANDVTFNSFGKCKGTYFAGSDDGLYRRGENGWRQVADTSGPLTVTSVAENDDGTFTVICGTAAVATRVDVDGFSGSVSSVDSTDVYNPGSVQRFIGFDDDGSLYTIVSGRRYDEGTSGYNGGALYKYVDGAWQYQVADGFNDPNEDSDPARKLRPDGIRKIMIPHDHVTLFYGEAGAVYAQYGETTIRFEENEGSEVADITRPAGSAVTAPASPTLEGYSFAGWYTKPSCLAKYLYSFGTMPYKDITLYAKWVETGEDALETIRAAALETLETAYGRYDEGEFAPKDWNTLVKAYKTGKKDIAAGENYDAVQTALNTAVAAMSAVEKTTEITVAVTIEKLIVDGTYIMEPRLVTVPSHPMASVVLTDLLKEMYADAMPILNGSGYNPYRITGRCL